MQLLPSATTLLVEPEFAQLCFVVEDLDAAMPFFTARLGAGPWFPLSEIPEELDRTTYRGVPTPLGARIALGYTGGTMIELVEPKAGSRSIFSDWAQEKGFGLHHFGFVARDFDAVERSLGAAGLAPLMTSVTPLGARVAMVGGGAPFGAFEEYIELMDTNARFYDFMRARAADWDRTELIYTKPFCLDR